MEKINSETISRRRFISSASSLVLGGCALSLAPMKLIAAQEKLKLSEELTPEELKLVEQSVMAQDIPNYFGKGYS